MKYLSNKKIQGVAARTNIGQHFMVNEDGLRLMIQQVPAGSVVIEIGAGLGQLTRKLAPLAQKVIAIEIDNRFKDGLENIQKRYPNVEVVIGNALKVNFNLYPQSWIVGNIPYHITEPLLHKLIKTNTKGIVLLVGDSFAYEATAIETNSTKIGKLSILVHTFYHPEIIVKIDKKYFDPPPRTESAILKLIPCPLSDYKKRSLFLFKQLFLTSHKSPLVKNVLTESLVRFEGMKLTKNKARQIVSSFNLPDQILNKPFEQLNNDEYRRLYEALKK